MKAELFSLPAWIWKTGLLTASATVAAGQIWRLQHHSIGAEWIAVSALGGFAATVWAGWNEHRRASTVQTACQTQPYFLAAAETNLDAFTLLEPVEDASGSIVDFRFRYLNSNMERLLGASRSEVLGQGLLKVSGLGVDSKFFHLLCSAIEAGDTVNDEFLVTAGYIRASWLRAQAVRFGDGVAVTCSDISESKSAQARYAHLADFTNSIFENAPFSIIATDTKGLITAMNAAAEKLTGFRRSELVGVASLTSLHDGAELLEQTSGTGMSAFDALTLKTSVEDIKEREWTLIRKGGARTPINLAMRALASKESQVTGFVSVAFDMTEQKQMLDYVTHLATHDQLTGLAGRALLQDRTIQAVEEAKRKHSKVAVFMIDLDNFKRLNDSLGHAAGDQLLIEAARRLRRSVRSTDLVARVGGDEFVVVMADIYSIEDMDQCAANLVRQLTPEISIETHQVQLTASVGVCIYPDFATDAKHLLKRADSAMYAAKENGRNQHLIFNQGMLKETAERLTMEHALRHALANGELSLHYQPQISLTNGTVIGMEALLRWTHPKLGNVPPAQFIPLAEETGLIVPIGEWAFATACRESMEIQQELGVELTVSVNLSPRQFQQRELVQAVSNALTMSGLPAERLQIEITENMLMVTSGSTLEMLEKIRELGVKISIDDFGTGFSSFSYLLQYQVDRLKIDQSFVKKSETDPNAAAVVRTIIAMSHGLNIKVVAEGVESMEQLRFLLRKRCDEAQGNFIAKPVVAEEFSSLVRTYNADVSVRAPDLMGWAQSA